ncbi:hypothetical protein ACO0LB_17820 [Undibacterium sp. SXout7W]|uniref:hypothetical protein n=1 Tax=Undibacterium sp. SXout7W TaxID=3413049 RepID=UPI003BF13AF9
MISSTSQRMRLILSLEAPIRGASRWLEVRTAISKKTWQSFFTRENAAPSAEMIESISRLFPEYAFWLASGLTDQTYGHTCPRSENTSQCFPEVQLDERKYFADYFVQCMKLQEQTSNVRVHLEGPKSSELQELERLMNLRQKEIAYLNSNSGKITFNSEKLPYP